VDAVVMAAGEGRRLRPLTKRWPKPVLPIDGRPVLATLLRELASVPVRRVFLVTGHLAEQVERLAGDGSAFGLEVRTVRQPRVLGSSDAVRRAVDTGAAAPFVAVAADTVFRAGDLRRFVERFSASGAAGAIAVRRDPPPEAGRPGILVRDGLVEAIWAPGVPLSGAPLWALTNAVVSQLCLDREPYELENAFRSAMAGGARIAAVEIGKTRDLTDPLDLVEENFPYLVR
jgi:UDP-N-acetylglucosamine diphosphorylase / glucose-1-phosphate thymidylyltransferase / UDP-N-acetylgalactosamine diphosphorylase / glucosamine-1-phosphate N-acetyltransferase / galactosamine-1-phosphate N-acetyltransferase